MIELRSVDVDIGSYSLRNISFAIDSGKYAVLMGRTGIGKTTILEVICGLRAPASGAVLLDGVEVTAWPPANRNIAYVPQDLALFPTFTVREHLEFAMKLRKSPRKTMADRVSQLSEELGIGHLLRRRVQGLSGGESQRVALGRALSFGPSLLLLDEPLSALDAETRNDTQDLLKRINETERVTVLHVTHNQHEADVLADQCLRFAKDAKTGTVTLE